MEEILSPITEDELAALERDLAVPLPESYKRLLRCSRGFNLLGGAIQFGPEHPFFHNFTPFNELSPDQQEQVTQNGEGWPPPSNGMLCFAEFFLEADGDQVLFDVSSGLKNGEYPIYYYSHEETPPSIRKMGDRFDTWFEGCVAQFDSKFGAFEGVWLKRAIWLAILIGLLLLWLFRH